MIYFITPTYLKENTAINDNVDSQMVTPIIRLAADTYVRSYLGTYFYQDLLTKYNDQTLDPNEEILVRDYIKMAVAWRAAAETILTASYQLTNKGTAIQNGDFSQSPEYKAIMFIFHDRRDKADFYDQRLIDYLTVHKKDFPNFMSDLNDDSKISKYGCDDVNGFQSCILLI